MTNELTLLKQEMFGDVLFDVYRNEDNEVFMTAEQLGESLGYSTQAQAITNIVNRNEYLKNEEFSVQLKLSSTDGKSYNTRVFTEDGIYEITMLSKQPKAKEFRFFIRNLLKGLRKGELEIKKVPRTYVEALRALADSEEEKEKLSEEVVGLNYTIGLMEPKVDYYNTILSSTDTLNITQIAKDYGLSGHRLNKLLNEERIQYKIGGQWVLYQKYAAGEYTRTHTHSYDREDGTTGTNLQTKWTQKGRLLIHNILTDKGYVAEMDKEKEAASKNASQSS